MCNVENCDGKIYARGICHMHYQRFMKYGDVHGGIKNHASIEERFWKFVVKNEGCWSWSGNKSYAGYGRISAGAKKDGYKLAHRLSWEIHNAAQIPYGMFVMHKCDNPECTNPDHLTIGTPKENTQDMIRKGRKRSVAPVGRGNGKSILDEEKVQFIRSSNLSHAEVGRILGVSPNCVRGVRIGRTWSHVPFPEQLS
jgi:hypothetical protein